MKTNGYWILKRDLGKPGLFRYRFCFINYLCATNDHQEFDNNINNIYPSELQLKKEKRDAFPFSIVCVLHLDSKIPLNIHYE